MDPLTIITVVGSCTHLALRSMTLVNDIGRLKDKLRHVERDVQMVVVQVNAIKGVVNQLSQWLQQNATSRTKELLPEVSGVLECCTDLVTLIGEHVEKVKSATGSKLRSMVVQYLGEDRLKEYQHMLQGQAQALSLLIQCLQLRSPADRKSFIQLVENNTTLIQGTFEVKPPKSSTTMSAETCQTNRTSSERKDSAIALLDPTQLRLEKLSMIEAAPSQDEYHRFIKDMPRPTAGLKVGSERRLYAAKTPGAKVDPYADTNGEDATRQKGSGFGLKFLGKMSRKSVIQFEKLTMPQVLLDWPQWHRQQRSKAIEDGKDLTAVLNSGLYTAVRLRHVDYIEELFENGAGDTSRYGSTWTLMHHAVEFADERIITMLCNKGVNPDIAVERHGAPLHYAAQHGNERVIQLLLGQHADPNVMDSNTRPPMYFALRYLLAIDHRNKQTDPSWPFGKHDASRSAVCYQLRVGVRNVLLLLHHGAQPSSEADEQRWRSTIQQKLSKTHTHNLPELIHFLADPLAREIFEATIEVYLWIQHALKDSMREAARGSVSGARPKSRESSGKSVRFVEPKRLPSRSGQPVKKTADAERLELLLGLK